MCDIEQIAWVTRDATHHIYDHTQMQLIATQMQLIATQLQLCHNNYFSTTMQLPYDTNHNGMLTSFSSIHQNLTNGTMNFFWWICFWNIDIHCPLWLLVWTLCIMHRCVTSTMFGSCFWFFLKKIIFSNNCWSPPPTPARVFYPVDPPKSEGIFVKPNNEASPKSVPSPSWTDISSIPLIRTDSS
jgi:hypothetical protein